MLLAGERLLAVNVRPTVPHGGPTGQRGDPAGHHRAARPGRPGQLARARLQLLYDAGVRIGTTLDVVRTAEELAEIAVPRFADFVTVELLDEVLPGEEPDGGRPGHAPYRRAAASGTTPRSTRRTRLITFLPSMPQAEGLRSGTPCWSPI